MPEHLSRRGFIGAAVATGTHRAVRTTKTAEPYAGIFVIMQTPFHQSLEIDEDSLRREADFLVRCGVHGMVWPAGASETSSLSYTERLKFSEAIVREVKGRTPVFIGVHAPNKFEAGEYARHAERMGADGLHALGQTDGAADSEILAEYFSAITSASRLPLCIQVSSPALTPGFLIDLAKRLPTFRYVKEEGYEVPKKIGRYLTEAKGLLTPMTGGGAMNLLNEMARGSRGTMAGAGFADIQVQIWELYQKGSLKEARDLFSKFLMMAVLERQTTFVLMKEILRRRGVFKTVVMRNTRKFAMDPGDLRELDEIYELVRPYFRV